MRFTLTFAYFHVALLIANENTNFDYDFLARVVLQRQFAAIDNTVLYSGSNVYVL